MGFERPQLEHPAIRFERGFERPWRGDSNLLKVTKPRYLKNRYTALVAYWLHIRVPNAVI